MGANITNAFGEKPSRRAWNSEPQLAGQQLASFTIPISGSLSFYDGQAMGRDANGTLVQMDDTAPAEFIGFLTDVAAPALATVASTDTLGDNYAKGIDRPYAFVCLIAAASRGQEGRKVFWLYNNQVAFSTAYGNLAGTVLGVLDSTHVLVLAPWCRSITQGGDLGMFTANAASGTTLTKFISNKIVLMPLTSSEAITLPAANSLSPGDKITFINTSSNSSTPTLTAAGADTINGGATYVQSTTQYAVAVLRTDGVSKWYVEVPGPSGTVGATTFTGNVGVSSATLVVTDNVNNTLAVGPNGATNPCLDVDCSVGSAATGLSIQGQASGSGVKLTVITSGTNEDLLVLPAGSGAVKITSTGAAGLTVGPNGATNPTFQVVCNVSSEATGLKVTGAAAASGLALAVISSGTNENLTLDAKGSGTISLGSVSTGNVLVGSGLLVDGGTGGLGYGTGVGGTVTQITSRTTGVTLSKLSGAITLVSAAGSATAFTMTVTNTLVAATDTVVVSQKSGTDAYSAVVSAVGAGSYKLTITDLTGTTTEQPVFNVNVIKGVAA